MKIISRTSMIGATAAAMAAYAAFAVPAFAQTQLNATVQGGISVPASAPGDDQRPPMMNWQNGDDHRGPGNGNGMRMRPGVMGTVAAINGTMLTVSGRSFVSTDKAMATTTYTVDASSATIYKNNATSTLSSVAINDRVFVQGTISGTNVTATVIRGGIPAMMRRPGGSEGGPGSMRPPVQGNGQPVVAGTVSSVTGNTVTITTSSNTSFTIDAANAAIMKGNASSTVSSIATGDYIVVQGAVNGSSVTASSIVDGRMPAGDNGRGNGGDDQGNHLGFLGSIGHFFKSIFGF